MTLAAMLGLSIVILGGCDGQTQEAAPTASASATSGDSAFPEAREASAASGEPATQPSASQDDAAAASDSDVQLKPLPLELPEPAFIGTPADLAEEEIRFEEGAPDKRPPFEAPADATNLALGKPVTSSDPMPIIGTLEMVTDGDKDARDFSYVEVGFDSQWVQVDLEEEHTLYAIVFWQRHDMARVYRDVIVQVSNDPAFEDEVVTLFNNDHDNSSGHGVGEDYEFVADYQGKLVDAQGISARYVRVYSAGSTMDDFNHFTEVEVWGR